MKKVTFFLPVLLLTMSYTLFGQDLTSSIRDTSFNYTNGNLYTAFVADIPGAKSEDVIANWKKALEKGNKVKTSATNSLITFGPGVIKSIATDSVKVVSEVFQTTSGTRISASFIYANDAIGGGKDPVKTSAAKIWLGQFLNSNYSSSVKDELKTEEKNEKTIEKELSKNQSSIDKLRSKISGSEADIESYKSNIKSLETDQGIKQNQLDEQKKFIATIPTGNSDSKKQADKTLKTMEKDVDKVLKSIKKENANISKAENTIRDHKNSISKLEGDQKVINDKLAMQRDKVRTLKEKLKSIK